MNFVRSQGRRASRPRGRARFGDTRGFTILEVALAAFVMAFGLVSSILTMQSGFKSLDLARGTTLASQILQSEMESLRLMNWAQISALPASGTVDVSSVFVADTSLTSRYAVTRTVTDVTGRTGEMKEIVLSVVWSTFDGMPHTRSFRTRYCKNGLYDYYYTLARS